MSAADGEGAEEAAATVLVVDDEEFVREFCAEALEHEGYAVVAAESGAEAVRVLEARGQEIACVVLDLSMPVMDGEATLRELRRIRPDVKVILASGFSEPRAGDSFPPLAVSGFLRKPYRLKELYRAVADAVRE